MDMMLKFPDGVELFMEDVDIRESMEMYMGKVDVWGVHYKGKDYRTMGGAFVAYDDKIRFVWDMEEKK